MTRARMWGVVDAQKRERARKKREAAAEMTSTREAIQLRSGGYCEGKVSSHCGGVGVAAHHVKMRSRGGGNNPENMAWLCTPCHMWVHDNPAEATELGLLTSQWES